MNSLVFDIETGPLPDDELRECIPAFVPPPHPGKFDPASVKTGNLKPENAAKKVEEAAAAHAEAVKNHDALCEQAREQHFADQKAKAALSPMTGQVLAIGVEFADSTPMVIPQGPESSEAEIIAFWMNYADEAINQGEKLIGWNTHGFDWPFLIKRAWRLGVYVPPQLTAGRFLPAQCVDLMDVWNVGNKGGMAKLDDVCRFVGLQGKLEGVDGSMFAELWANHRETAIKYLRRDVNITRQLAEKLGVL
jgi:predicted PolB exonuclease-like 3'-5' exonuclease